MKRREFIGLLGGAAAASPLAAWAQGTQQVRRVSMLLGLDEKDPETNSRVRAFRLGMRDLGWVEGRNVQIEYRFAGTKLESINKHVAEVIRLAPDVIVAHSSPVVAVLRPATSTIPIVVAMAVDPVGQGFISNLAHPGGNITGFSFIESEIIGKWINLLSDVKPDLSRVALMFNPDTVPYYDAFLRSFNAAPKQTSVEVDAAHVR
ncbi:MAG TPA: ABC transporter substrate-binding protein, partial [Pseudolabrys sp.]|nr:ABC transporter substrate-binding protein [Pseudolabrys sp.]